MKSHLRGQDQHSRIGIGKRDCGTPTPIGGRPHTPLAGSRLRHFPLRVRWDVKQKGAAYKQEAACSSQAPPISKKPAKAPPLLSIAKWSPPLAPR
jgi:hypothetical protein